jgi:hypothetical protein
MTGRLNYCAVLEKDRETKQLGESGIRGIELDRGN